MSHIQEIPEIKQYWDSFSNLYSQQDDGTNVFYLSLLNMLKVNTRKQILEVGAGAGFLYNHTMNYKRPEASYVATDLSDKMLSIMCKRLQIQEEFKGQLSIEKYNLKVEKANGEQLQYSDNTFDCYIANLCLQITTNPEKMVAEAFRVLQKGGVAGFTVWGDKASSYFFNIVPEVLAKYGIQPPTTRTMFHLNDREKLIKMLEDAGFTNVICWNQFSPFHHQTEDEFNTLLNYPRLRSLCYGRRKIVRSQARMLEKNDGSRHIEQITSWSG
ncbi:hypothetical protein ABPG72_017967, partial [Tetrahymena utriculariae]